MNRSLLQWLALVTACSSGRVRLSDLEDAGDVADACEEYEPQTDTIEVLFDAQTDPCPWGEAGTITPVEGYFTAHAEQVQTLDVPEDAVICDMTFDFSGLVPGEVQEIVYDDHFFFMFNDIVLAASFGPAVDEFEADGRLRIYDWPPIKGYEYHFDSDPQPYCLGEDEGRASCEIPTTQVHGPISLSFDDGLVAQLSYDAIQAGRYDFLFSTTGDNDATDCQHEAFGFTVEVPYLEP